MPTYIIEKTPLETYYSDSSPTPNLPRNLDPMYLPSQSEIGFDPKDKNNVTYKKYQKNYQTFRVLAGFNVRSNKSFRIQVGDVFTIYADNILTNSPTNSKTYTLTITSTSTSTAVPQMLAMIGAPDQIILGPGTLEIYGICTDPSGQFVKVFPSTYVTQTPP